MKNLESMSKDERSLLLFIESCAVETGGLVDERHMNGVDRIIVDSWVEDKSIEYGRLSFSSIEKLQSAGTKKYTAWVKLSVEAWQRAHEERCNRFVRLYTSKTWQTTDEKRK